MKPEPVISVPVLASQNPIGHVANYTPDQVAAGKRAESYHGNIVRAFADQMGFAFMAGLELAALKESVGRGNFMEAREALFPSIPHRTSTRYIAFVGELCEFPQIAHLVKEPKLLLTEGGLKDEQREQVLNAVHEVADGKTLTQLYRDLGVIRDPKDPNATDKKTPEQLTPEQQLQAWKERDTAVLQQAIDLMRSLITPDEERPRYFEKETRKAAQQLSIEFTKFLKRGAPARAPKEKKKTGKPTPEERAKLSAAARTRWAEADALPRGPKQETWIAYRSAEGLIGVRVDDKLPPKEQRGLTDYEGPFNASGHDHAMAKARMLFAPKKRLMTPAQKAEFKKSQKKGGK